jgi:hypothetical protein
MVLPAIDKEFPWHASNILAVFSSNLAQSNILAVVIVCNLV